MHSPIIQKLIDLFAKFPTVGPRTAARFVFYLLKLSPQTRQEIISAINDLDKVKVCERCFFPYEIDNCPICSDPRRDKTLLCVVEKEADLNVIEKSKNYKGLYFILGNIISTFKKQEIKDLKVEKLVERIKSNGVEEIIIAINPTTEGEATALYLERTLKPLGKKITRLGRGLPVGAEIEYADNETIASAFGNRK